MKYNARKLNNVIRDILTDAGQPTSMTHSDKRTYGRRISFQPAFFEDNYRPLDQNSKNSLLTKVVLFLSSCDVTNVHVEISESVAFWNGEHHLCRLNLHVTE